MKKEIYSVTKGDQVYEMTLNKPSDFIKLLLCNPEKGKKISCLPDRTPEIRISLNQGHKWLYDSEFRCPMIVGDGSSRDLWIGDILKVQSIDSISSELYMISNFFISESINYCETFELIILNENITGIECNSRVFELSSIDYQSIIRYNTLPVGNFFSVIRNEDASFTSRHDIDYFGQSLAYHHHSLFIKIKQVHDKASSVGARKIKIIPLTLFSDDTSGNTTKKWNCYDSWIMTPAVLPLKDRNMYENQFFLCTHHNLNAMDTASRLVEDLKSLEDGMVMYDLEYDEEVLVYAPVLFITGDNVRHSEICCSKGSRSTCTCRKSFWHLDPPQPKNRPVTPVRTRLQDYVAAPRFKMYSVMYAIDELPKLPAPGVTLRNRGRGAGRNPNESTPGQEDA